MKFEVSELLFHYFGTIILKEGDSWSIDHLKNIERILDETLGEDSLLKNESFHSSLKKNSVWKSTNEALIKFIRGLFNHQPEKYQKDLLSKVKNINFDVLIKKDFDNLERTKKTLLLSIDQPNFMEDPYYYLNKAIFFFFIQTKRPIEYTIHSRVLLNVFYRIFFVFIPIFLIVFGSCI